MTNQLQKAHLEPDADICFQVTEPLQLLEAFILMEIERKRVEMCVHKRLLYVGTPFTIDQNQIDAIVHYEYNVITNETHNN